MKTIVLLTGSPRKKGNSMAMADAFQETAMQLGHRVIRFDAAFHQVDGCRACECCYSQGQACVFDDDFNPLAAHILQAEAIVFALPVYWYSLPGKLKNVIDKMYAYAVADKQAIYGKACGLMACCEENDRSVLDGVRIPIERSAAFFKWKMVGEVLIPGVLNIGDIEKTTGIAQARALANQI